MKKSKTSEERWRMEDSWRRPFPVKISKPGENDKIFKPVAISGMGSPTRKIKKEKDKRWVKHEGKWVKC